MRRLVVRSLDWQGFRNARDLGGLPTVDGRVTRHGAFVRAGGLITATPAGLQAMRDAGIRTVLDLRNEYETRAPVTEAEKRSMPVRVQWHPEPPMPDGVFQVRVPLEDPDPAAWERLVRTGIGGTPLWFRDVLDHAPERLLAVIRAIIASPGGVLFHCAVGRDRTGLVAAVLLDLAGVTREAIVEDYLASEDALRPVWVEEGMSDPSERIREKVAQHGYTVAEAVEHALDGFEAARFLRDHGIPDDEIASLRGRLVGDESAA